MCIRERWRKLKPLLKALRVDSGVQSALYIGNPDDKTGQFYSSEKLVDISASLAITDGFNGAMAAATTRIRGLKAAPAWQLQPNQLSKATAERLLLMVLHVAGIKKSTFITSEAFRSAHSWFPAQLCYTSLHT